MATEWKKVQIQTVCLGIYDGPHATPPICNSGSFFLGISNITPDGHLDLSSPKYISEIDFPKWTKRVTPYPGDIVFSYEATLNLYAIIPPGFKGCLGRRMALIRPNLNIVDRYFLFYYFFSPEWRKCISENTILGATVDRIPISRFPEFEISLPPLETQQKIAGILSVYDDLIENNRKQIKLLEEAAQKLYKEWFVKLNFPGHENVKIVDGLPEGWEKERLEDWCRVFTGKKNANQNVEKGLYPFFTCAPEPLLSNGSLYEGKAVIISGNGSYTGRTQYYDGNFDLYQRTYACVKQKQEDYEYMPFIYYTMKILFEPIKMGGTKGAAIPYIVMSDITDTEFLYQYDICKKFSNFAEYVLDKIQTLQNQIKLSKQVRDKLLPRLMNGELL